MPTQSSSLLERRTHPTPERYGPCSTPSPGLSPRSTVGYLSPANRKARTPRRWKSRKRIRGRGAPPVSSRAATRRLSPCRALHDRHRCCHPWTPSRCQPQRLGDALGLAFLPGVLRKTLPPQSPSHQPLNRGHPPPPCQKRGVPPSLDSASW
eukprot:1389667-Amorphochlora_amoeboformis.AAC.1